ncbi:MAG: ribosome-associated translation inhibitor RaiA [Patescibacteria group bacterium]
MNIIIKTKNLELTDSLENLINKKMVSLKKLVKNLQESSELLFEVEKETKHHRKGDIFKSEAMINLPGTNLVARSHGENLGRVITKVKSEMEREIRKYKSKTVELPRRKYRKTKREII